MVLSFTYFKSANAGNAIGMCYLGRLYESGNEVLPKDLSKAAELYLKSEALGCAWGQACAGYFYWKGFVLEKNEQKARELYEKSASKGSGDGYYGLGCLFVEGTEKDYEKGIKMLEKAVELGSLQAMYKLAFCYKTGIAVEKDLDKAIYWFKRGHEDGDNESSYVLGTIYISQMKDDLAMTVFERPLAHEHNNTVNVMGLLYEWGVIVEKDEQKAFDLFTKASKGYSAPAFYNMGRFYHFGKIVKQDIPLAISFYEKTLEMDPENHYATCMLGVCQEFEKKDISKAVEIYEKASKFDFPLGKICLALCYEYGTGVPKDVENAKELMDQSTECTTNRICALLIESEKGKNFPFFVT